MLTFLFTEWGNQMENIDNFTQSQRVVLVRPGITALVANIRLAKKFVWLVNTLFNKILGENEKCAFLLNTERTSWSTQYFKKDFSSDITMLKIRKEEKKKKKKRKRKKVRINYSLPCLT